MPAKRPPPRTEMRSTAPMATAAWLGSAAIGGVALLVRRGEMDWPPTELLTGLGTLAGCLALAGPLVIRRGGPGEVGLGDLIWLAGGLLVALFDVAALSRGDWRSLHWAMPLGPQAMGLSILAVGLAGWRSGLARPAWSWTNVTGCALGGFWVALALASFWPARGLATALR